MGICFLRMNKTFGKKRPLKLRRRGRKSSRAADKKRRMVSQENNDTAIKASMLHVMQANVGSLLTNLHEFRSRLAQQQPDIVLLQEDGIHDSTGIHFSGYFWAHQARSVPRSTGPVRGGGVSILVRTNGPHRINYEQLPTLNLDH